MDFGSLHYKSISARSCIWYMLLYFSIKAQKHALPELPIVKFFYNYARVTSYMYEGTVAKLYNF